MRMCMLVLPHLAKEGHVRRNSHSYFRILDILDTVFLAGAFDDLADGRIVYMGDLGKQVVFDLEIEAADQPANQLILGSKIGRRLDLVNGPFIFHLTRGLIRQREMGMLDRVSELEDDTQYETGHETHAQETDQPGQEANDINRQCYEDERVREFIEPEFNMLGSGHLTKRSRTDSSGEILRVISDEYPVNIK